MPEPVITGASMAKHVPLAEILYLYDRIAHTEVMERIASRLRSATPRSDNIGKSLLRPAEIPYSRQEQKENADDGYD